MSTPRDALTMTPMEAMPGIEQRSSLGLLARLEIGRLARHPIFILGVALGVLLTVLALNEQADQVSGDSLGLPLVALTVGLPAMICAHLLTRSFHGASELIESTPSPLSTRTSALCLTATVPAAVSSCWLILYYGFTPDSMDAPAWMYGRFSHLDIATVLAGHTVVAAVGGTLLGVAAGRWWRFRGAAAALLTCVTVWTIGVLGLFSSGGGAPAPWHRWVRLFAPVGYFTSATQHDVWVDSLTGSPPWYLVWLVSLCVLAAVAALLWRAEGAARRLLLRLGAAALVLSIVTYGLAAAGGPSHVVRTYPDGHSIVLAP